MSQIYTFTSNNQYYDFPLSSSDLSGLGVDGLNLLISGDLSGGKIAFYKIHPEIAGEHPIMLDLTQSMEIPAVGEFGPLSEFGRQGNLRLKIINAVTPNVELMFVNGK